MAQYSWAKVVLAFPDCEASVRFGVSRFWIWRVGGGGGGDSGIRSGTFLSGIGFSEGSQMSVKAPRWSSGSLVKIAPYCTHRLIPNMKAETLPAESVQTVFPPVDLG